MGEDFFIVQVEAIILDILKMIIFNLDMEELLIKMEIYILENLKKELQMD